MNAEAFIRTARSYRGHREVRPNSSPLIDHWLSGVGQPPGEPWCAAYVCAVITETDPRFAFFRSASAMRLLRRNPDRRISDPEIGALVCWDHGHGPEHDALTDHSHCPGHVALITDMLPDDHFSAIAGNTSEDGTSREGIMVAEHDFSAKDPKIAGYIRIATA